MELIEELDVYNEREVTKAQVLRKRERLGKEVETRVTRLGRQE